ncbi:MAG: VOC family protein [Acidimicrobiales bacterium]
MSVRIRTITFDCTDPYGMVSFWAQAIGYAEDPGNPNHPEDPEGLLVAPDGGANVLFVRVPEPKNSKNRVHLDLVPPDSSPEARDAELERLVALGATVVDDLRRPDRTGWVVLADPEGNEFCLERGLAGG